MHILLLLVLSFLSMKQNVKGIFTMLVRQTGQQVVFVAREGEQFQFPLQRRSAPQATAA